jgi:hypothetical protein
MIRMSASLTIQPFYGTAQWRGRGAETVVRALLEALGPDGTLMAYTGWQDARRPEDLGALE